MGVRVPPYAPSTIARMTTNVWSFRGLSLLQLILIGFAVVSLPVAFALATAWVSVDYLASKGQQAVVNAVLATQVSRNLVEDITNIERQARQYDVLGDPKLHESYALQRDSFLDSLARMQRLAMGLTVGEQLHRLESEAKVTFAVLATEQPGSEAAQAALDAFPRLGALARSVFQDNIRVVAREVDAMQREASATRQRLFWRASASVPAALVLVLIFALLIARPVRQLDQAIRSLGSGSFDRPIQVSGPHDLADLGRRLNWLRVRLIELEEQRTFFLHHVSHELKTPLTNIVEGAELLSEEIVGALNGQQQEIADIVHVNGMQLQQLIENLLRVSFAGSAAPVVDSRRIELAPLIRRLADRHKLSARAKGVVLKLSLNSETLWSDLERLSTILDNLLSNAIKFTAPQTVVRVVTRRLGNTVCIEVRDAGDGIRPEDREAVFDRFYQGASRGRCRVRGSGLGLFIAHEYAGALGGQLKVVNSDTGACLQLCLPRTNTPLATDQSTVESSTQDLCPHQTA